VRGQSVEVRSECGEECGYVLVVLEGKPELLGMRCKVSSVCFRV